MSMFNDISWRSKKNNEKECESNAQLVSLFAKRFGAGQWSFLGPGSEKKWYSISEDSPQGEWDKMAEKMMLKFAESGHPIFRATSPLSRGQLKSKGHGKLSMHYCADLETIKTVFRTIISVNQLTLYGAVAEKFEEYETFHDRTQEISEVQFKEYALKLDASNFACRSKAKAKPQRREPAGSSPRIVPIGKRTWTDIEPGKYFYFFSDYEVSKKVMYLLRHSQSVHREEDGAVHFWRIKENLQNQFPHSPHWSDSKWKVCLAGGGGGENKKRYQYCTDSSGTILYFRALQGPSGRNLIDPTLQDNVLIPNIFFQYTYHVGCAINFHSIINSGLTPGGQILSNRQTVFCLPVDPMAKNTRILTQSTWKHRVLHNTCRQRGRNIETLCIGSTSILL